MDAADRGKRLELFNELKPVCIKLSQLAVKSDGSIRDPKDLRDAVAQLLDLLERKCRDNDVFDDKLADYVFFPLQHVLRLSQNQTGRLIELVMKCIGILLEHGWSIINVGFGQQLLLLLTFFAAGDSPSSPNSEELRTAALRALASLFKVLHDTPGGAASLVDVENIPKLAQCLTVILEGITNSPSAETLLEALSALKSFWSCVKDRQALATFLPGTISALTRCLMPSSKTLMPRRALINGLDVYQKVLTTTLGDIATRNLKDEDATTDASSKAVTLTRSWLKATGGQVKLSLANIVKLRNHDHQDVRTALERMCLSILDECHTSLAESLALLVETAMSLGGSDEERPGSVREMSLKDLAIMHPPIAELIKGTIYNWVTSLPRVMQSNDEAMKQLALRRLSKAQDLLSSIDVNSDLLGDAFAESLRNSVISSLELSVSARGSKHPSIEDRGSIPLLLSSQTAIANEYRPIVMPHESQIQTREYFDNLLARIGSPEAQIQMASRMLEYMRDASGADLLSSFWLSFRLLQAAISVSSILDDIVDNSMTARDEQEAVKAELYTFAVSVISDLEDENANWQTRAIGLEVVAYMASLWGVGFRPQLIDTLYPIVLLLGSTNTELREHAIVTLDMVSSSCGYQNASMMIVDNVDYLVNCISLKLNTFDISPQAPQVLVMMIGLTGSSLLPYLEDVVGSIFAALDNFHGYPKLVESLFTVLGKIVDESGKSGQLQITAETELTHRKMKPEACKIEDIMNTLEKYRMEATRRDEEMYEGFPREPWKDARTLLDESDPTEVHNGEEDTNAVSVETPKPPPTKLYTMVQSIARHGQHYLTNESPYLRRRLLDLIGTACAALYTNEDNFLPLVNDIWPVLIKRLYDAEPFVVMAAARAVAEICKCAGDFMSTRIQVEWNDLMKLVQKSKTKAQAEKKGREGRGIYSQNQQVWETMISLLVAIVEYVRINDDMFDEMLEILADLLVSRDDVRTALSIVNADAVWLQLFYQGQYSGLKTPVLPEYKFCDIWQKTRQREQMDWMLRESSTAQQ